MNDHESAISSDEGAKSVAAALIVLGIPFSYTFDPSDSMHVFSVEFGWYDTLIDVVTEQNQTSSRLSPLDEV